ncbi:MAG: hypothetical protein GX452_06825 [Ignavibacteriales bacterium]|jgi:hypothetical protein|nr:hypothetical protein [Ignavibacteriaceae bacterium]NLH61100.1 hypothetical protein [Ignavibacteriales bacterium]HOJ17595.1 hypothetical protein [Ignavibacteriaceae bacterium]HPO55943.1 hypothetical protein [Ignavibacteriaceae bacterium]
MKDKKMRTGIIIILLFFIWVGSINPQGRRNAYRKIDQLEMVKLMDLLELDSETSAKFLAKRQAYVEKRRESLIRLDSLEKFIEAKVKEKEEGSNEVKKAVTEYLELEKKIVNLKYEHINSVKGFLTNEQMARYVTYEKRFRRELMEIIRENRRNKFNR